MRSKCTHNHIYREKMWNNRICSVNTQRIFKDFVEHTQLQICLKICMLTLETQEGDGATCCHI